jgi:K+-transporting ATPase ATPase C chain
MRKDIIRSAIVIVASTVVLGLIYPAVMVLFGQVFFSSQANGSLITKNGKTVGSKLAAQSFNGPRYFHERPSAVAYNADGTSFGNLGPNAKALRALVETRIARSWRSRGRTTPA